MYIQIDLKEFIWTENMSASRVVIIENIRANDKVRHENKLFNSNYSISIQCAKDIQMRIQH